MLQVDTVATHLCCCHCRCADLCEHDLMLTWLAASVRTTAGPCDCSYGGTPSLQGYNWLVWYVGTSAVPCAVLCHAVMCCRLSR
jgi:hypothetical protein